MVRRIDVIGKRFGRLVVTKESPERINRSIVCECQCDCGNTVNVKKIYLTNGDTKSCGCIKKENDNKNLREQYDNKRVDGVAKQLFKGKEPRKDSSTGYRGVTRYYTRKSKELRYRAWITIKGKRYYKSGFKSAEDAYYQGRIELENKYLPKKDGEQ